MITHLHNRCCRNCRVFLRNGRSSGYCADCRATRKAIRKAQRVLDELKALMPKRKRQRRHRSPKHHTPRGYYVYAWYDGDLCFYVGKGVDQRAWNKHYDTPAYHLRARAKNFHIRIIEDGLTELEAFIGERVLIKALGPIGNRR